MAAKKSGGADFPRLTRVTGWSGRLGSGLGFLLLLDLDDAQWESDEEFPIAANVDGVDAGCGEAHALEVHHHVAGEERDVGRELDFEFRLDGHVVGVEGLAVFVDDIDGELVAADVFLGEAEAHGERACRVNDGQCAGGEGVEGSGDDELAVVVCGEVANGGDLDVHEIECGFVVGCERDGMDAPCAVGGV